jgi:hypothetical protein
LTLQLSLQDNGTAHWHLAIECYSNFPRMQKGRMVGSWLSSSFAAMHEFGRTGLSGTPCFVQAKDQDMRDFRDAKAMAHTLSAALATKGLRIAVSQSLALENATGVARVFRWALPRPWAI